MELNILETIESTSKTSLKSATLQNNNTNSRLADLIDAALNYKRKFFIKKVDMPNPIANEEDLHCEFIQLLNVLESASHRGDAAKQMVESFFAKCTNSQQKWYYRVLTKDLKAGFSAETAKKCGFDVPLFDVQLAKDGKLNKKLETLMKSGGYASKKFDGYRCLADIDGDTCTLYSRSGTVYVNFPDIEQALIETFRGKGRTILDGEIMSDNFQAMQRSAFASSRGTTVGDVKYHIFDTVPVTEWETQVFSTKKSQRYKTLKDMFDTGVISKPNLVLVEHTYVNSVDDILKLEKQWLSEGYEGAMWVPDIPYYLGKKSNKMLKFKTFQSEDVTIIGFNKGEAGTKYENTLGSFICRQENGKTCDCGSGLSDEDRDYIWNHQSEFLGRIFEAKYQEKSQHDCMRFPIFKRWRDISANTGKI